MTQQNNKKQSESGQSYFPLYGQSECWRWGNTEEKGWSVFSVSDTFFSLHLGQSDCWSYQKPQSEEMTEKRFQSLDSDTFFNTEAQAFNPEAQAFIPPGYTK